VTARIGAPVLSTTRPVNVATAALAGAAKHAETKTDRTKASRFIRALLAAEYAFSLRRTNDADREGRRRLPAAIPRGDGYGSSISERFFSIFRFTRWSALSIDLT
jgi:hypothetical protein